MRNTLEDLYYGNITPNAQDMAPHSELKRAADRVARFENQLTEQLDEAGTGKFHPGVPAGSQNYNGVVWMKTMAILELEVDNQ